MTRAMLLAATVLLTPLPATALSPEAGEFIAISRQLEPVQCEKRRLRREIAAAEIEQRRDDEKKLRARFSALERNRQTAPLEKRLAALAPRVQRSSDPEDLAAISRHHTEAFYRCE